MANSCEGEQLLAIKNARKMISNINVPVTSISLSGGEPFLHPNLHKLYYLFNQNYPTSITTNGTIACYEIFFMPSDEDPPITVSLNAIDEDIDHRMRGTYCALEPLISNVRFLSTKCKTLKVNTIVCSANIDHLHKMGYFLAGINARDNLLWSLIQITLNSNVVAECPDLMITERQFEETTSNLQEIFEQMINMKFKTSTELERDCYMISPSGDVFNMAKSNKAIGNILEEKFSRIIDLQSHMLPT